MVLIKLFPLHCVHTLNNSLVFLMLRPKSPRQHTWFLLNDELLSGFTGSGPGCRHCHTEHFFLWTNQKYSRLCIKSVWLYLHNLGVDAEHLPTIHLIQKLFQEFFLVNMHFYLHWFIFLFTFCKADWYFLL